jgi:hypothetical protein
MAVVVMALAFRTPRPHWQDRLSAFQSLGLSLFIPQSRSTNGLCSALISAKEENDLQRRDALLVEMGKLQQAWPHDVAVRRLLAQGLVNTLVYAKQENDLQRRDALLVELRQLRQAWLEDTAVRELLAKGLVNMLVYAKQENDLARRDALLVELSRRGFRRLQRSNNRQSLGDSPIVMTNLDVFVLSPIGEICLRRKASQFD